MTFHFKVDECTQAISPSVSTMTEVRPLSIIIFRPLLILSSSAKNLLHSPILPIYPPFHCPSSSLRMPPKPLVPGLPMQAPSMLSLSLLERGGHHLMGGLGEERLLNILVSKAGDLKSKRVNLFNQDMVRNSDVIENKSIPFFPNHQLIQSKHFSNNQPPDTRVVCIEHIGFLLLIYIF